MARNLDEFAADLAAVTAQAAQAGIGTLKADALLEASRQGDEQAVRDIANSMSTAELQAFQRKHG
ncbi:hypothetical protein [Streptomyces sp.]|uniref:hypothetical protein n=1 Tax=Streptomyces sp. TaxID=1931 RepID=UPI002811E493|nr:hypothetical protein [Streptomyces sp.]